MLRKAILLPLAICFAMSPSPALADTAADENLLRRAHIGSDNADLLDYFKRRIVSDSERTRILDLIQQLGSEAYAIRERAGGELVEIGLPAVGLLRQNALNADVEIARRCERCLARIERGAPFPALSSAVARLIAVRKPPGAAGILIGVLPFADDETVADEIREAMAAVAATGAQIDPALMTALEDAKPERRAAAAEALIRTRLPAGIEAGRKMLADSAIDVRMRSTMALVTSAKDRAAVPKLIQLLGELPQSTAWRVEGVLLRLAGEQGPRVPLGRDEASRLKCRDAWNDWWKENGERVDLARLDVAPPMIGNTLVIVRDRSGATGKVMELNPVKDVLWSIAGLQMPTDAVVVGKDRVLIAEHLANRVSERDWRGTIIWSMKIELPVSVQRLPNGNTLAVGRNVIAEWSPERTEVFTYTRGSHDIVAAVKLPDGEIVMLLNQGKCVRLNRDREEIKSFQAGGRNYLPFAGIDALPGGNVILTLLDKIVEYDREGVQKSSMPASKPVSVQRLANGNTLVATTGTNEAAIVELDSSGKAIWEFKPADGMIPFRARRR